MFGKRLAVVTADVDGASIKAALDVARKYGAVAFLSTLMVQRGPRVRIGATRLLFGHIRAT